MGSSHSSQRSAASAPAANGTQLGASVVQRKCAACGVRRGARDSEEAETAQRSESGAAVSDTAADDVSLVTKGAGQPLGAQTRALMEPHFGHDFSGVRVHTDSSADRAAQALGANAFTMGRDLVFAHGHYAPESLAGQQLIAHELTHVVQQASGPVSGRAHGGLSISDPGDAFEQQADAMASRLPSSAAAAGAPAALQPLAASSSASVQRQPAAARRSPQRTRSSSPSRATARARSSAAPAAGARMGPLIVEDGSRAVGPQMQRSAFINAAHRAVLDAVNAEFRPLGRSANDCPLIQRTVARYSGRSARALMQFIRSFGRPSSGASADEAIRAIVAKSRQLAQRIVARQAPRAVASAEPGRSMPPHEAPAIRRQLGSGRALEPETRERMESGFHADFSEVRVHDDERAARASDALGARAFTLGQDVAFGSGEYRPHTPGGDFLIAHELAHTLQQRGGAWTASEARAVPALEQQADRAASAALSEQQAAPPGLSSSPLGVQRLPVVVAGAIVVAEATPEIIIVAEVATVSTEVVVVEGALVTTAELAPVVMEAAPAALEVALPAVEAAAPIVETAATTTAATSTAATATTVAVAATATTLSSDSPTSEEEEEEQGRCNSYPAPVPLPIAWPVELPEIAFSMRLLVRTPSAGLEWYADERSAPQRQLQQEINRSRDALLPVPSPCSGFDIDPNTPCDAHHIQPLYLGGEESEYNLCALETLTHHRGHSRLDNQTGFLDVYEQYGICSPFLSRHPEGQMYEVVAEK